MLVHPFSKISTLSPISPAKRRKAGRAQELPARNIFDIGKESTLILSACFLNRLGRRMADLDNEPATSYRTPEAHLWSAQACLRLDLRQLAAAKARCGLPPYQHRGTAFDKYRWLFPGGSLGVPTAIARGEASFAKPRR
jgi:hypothetical protein